MIQPTIQAPPRARPPRHAARGMTMVEVMVAILVLTVAVFILSSTVTASVSHSIVKAERTLAVEAAMNTIERIRSLPQHDVFALYNRSAADDPYGAGTAPGATFDVEGLDPQPDGLGGDAPIGQILMPGDGSILDESLVQPEFGLPRDLDGNLVIEAGDCSSRYIVLPLTVQIRWQSRLGPRTFEMTTMLSDLAKWKE